MTNQTISDLAYISTTSRTAGREVGLSELTEYGSDFDSVMLPPRRLEGGNSVNCTSGIEYDSVSWSAIGVANRREMVDNTDRESVGWEREGENIILCGGGNMSPWAGVYVGGVAGEIGRAHV